MDDKQNLLAEEILADATRKAERTVKRANAEADRIRRAALDDVRQQAETIENAGAEQARRTLEQATNGLPLELRIYELKARDRYVQEVFDRVLADFAEADGDARREAITRLAVEAVAAVGGSEVHVQLEPADAAWADAAWLNEVSRRVAAAGGTATAVKMAAPSRSARGGVIAASPDGRVRMNNTLAARLERNRDALRSEAAEALFGDD
jgi:vacuolar-type H+-ATPase subunit E/Vma4